MAAKKQPLLANLYLQAEKELDAANEKIRALEAERAASDALAARVAELTNKVEALVNRKAPPSEFTIDITKRGPNNNINQVKVVRGG